MMRRTVERAQSHLSRRTSHEGRSAVPPEERVNAELKKGKNEIRFQITGSNPDAEPANHMMGLDYLRIVD